MPTIVGADEDLTPGGAAWLCHMSSSKAAALFGLDEYESRYSLWKKMAGHKAAHGDENDETRRGHYLEPAVARWFKDQRNEFRTGEWELVRTRAWRDDEHPELVSSPDYVICTRDSNGQLVPIAVLECKSNLNGDKWGRPYTDEVPRNYLAQCLWHGRIIRVPKVYVAVVSMFLRFEEYIIDMTEPVWAEESQMLVDEAVAFLDTLPGRPNEHEPDPVGDAATYQVVRTEYEDIDQGSKFIVSDEQAAELVAAAKNSAEADEHYKTLRILTMQQMGAHHKLVTTGGQAIGSRTKSSSGSTYLKVNTSVKAFKTLRETAAESNVVSAATRETFTRILAAEAAKAAKNTETTTATTATNNKEIAA